MGQFDRPWKDVPSGIQDAVNAAIKLHKFLASAARQQTVAVKTLIKGVIMSETNANDRTVAITTKACPRDPGLALSLDVSMQSRKQPEV